LIAARREGKEESTESKDGVYWLERFEYIKEVILGGAQADGFWCEKEASTPWAAAPSAIRML